MFKIYINIVIFSQIKIISCAQARFHTKKTAGISLSPCRFHKSQNASAESGGSVFSAKPPCYLSDEELRPIEGAAALVTANSELCKRGREDVLSVSLGVHPAVNHLLRCGVAVSYVLACRAVGNSQLVSGSEARAAVRSGVGKRGNNLLCPYARNSNGTVVTAERGKSVAGSLGVYKADNLVLVSRVEFAALSGGLCGLNSRLCGLNDRLRRFSYRLRGLCYRLCRGLRRGLR